MHPSIWGKHFWITIHMIALGYDDNPTLKKRKEYQDFFTDLYKIIPCDKCSVNYKRHLEELPIFSYLNSKQNLFKWTVMIHNIVSRELGKQQWNTEYAYTHYTSTSFSDVSDVSDITATNSTLLINDKGGFNVNLQYLMIGTNVFICLIIICLIVVRY